ncbi:MAG: aldo/keto reductase [Granulosicoccus sp.]
MHKPPLTKALKSLGLQDNPIVTGLWQVADLERNGVPMDRNAAANELIDYASDGFSCFDMADHYGSAELIAGAARSKLIEKNNNQKLPSLFTKWCPQPHECTNDAVRRGVLERRERLGVDCIDLLQLHWWSFDHPGYIDVMDTLMTLKEEGWIRHIGVTNFDTDHLQVLLSCGHEIATNQVCLSVLDPRALGDMTELCQQSNVRLLAYGSLAGGFLSDRWLNAPEPAAVSDWSKMKYQRFIQAIGGWSVFQSMLNTLHEIAVRHSVSISNVATRWVLDQSAVAGVIVGARLTERQHRENNKIPLTFQLSSEDHDQINQCSQQLSTIAGDCGTEYRRPPFLTASGDLSDHLDTLPPVFEKVAVPGKALRFRISSGSEYEPVCGYSRAVRDGNRVMVSGTTATHGADRIIGKDDLQAQTVYILDKISASLAALGASLDDVIRTRIFMVDVSKWETVSRVHGRYFADCLPANTLVEVSRLVGDYAVEIEAEALVG